MDFLGKKQEALLTKYNIEVDRRYSNCIPFGWVDMLDELFQKMIDAGWDRKIVQIKEKFGSLRIYTRGAPEEVHKLINEADSKSSSICYYCGQPSTNDGPGQWVTYLCDEHKDVKWTNVEEKVAGYKENYQE